MIPMLRDELLDRLPGVPGYRTHAWATHFVPEADLQDRLKSLIDALPSGFELSFRTRFPENHIGLHASCWSPELSRTFDETQKKITSALGADAFSEGVELEELSTVVLRNARESEAWISCVESCTGGLIASKLTSVAGASQNFFAGWTTYHNGAKEALGVDPALLAKHGAVSEPVARAMAERGLAVTEAGLGTNPAGSIRSFCLSTTGIAGPSGGSLEKPVGLCFIGLATSGTETLVEEVRAPKGLERQQYQSYFAQKALNLLRLRIDSARP